MTPSRSGEIRRYHWLRGPVSRAACVAVALFALSCASTQQNEAVPGRGVSGTWVLNHGLSQSLAAEMGGAPAVMRRYARATDRIVLVQGHASLTLTFADASRIEVASDREFRSTSERGGIEAWWDETLVVEHTIGGFMIVERYTRIAESDRLLVTVRIPGRSAELLRIYDRR